MHGDASAAADEAQRGYEDFQGVNPKWAWEFAILRARAQYRQGKYEEMLKNLSLVQTPAYGELSIKTRWLEGLAYTSLAKLPEAEQKFVEAEGLCAGSESRVCGNVKIGRAHV